MIPVRVHLQNFLCYGETEQGQPHVFDFDGSPLWSISGDNGAGKSAIFDAITYALYGQHRGGSQEDSRLIRKGANSCTVIFDFQLDHHLYRVRRTIARPKGKAGEKKTWQAARFDPANEGWRPIPETERAVQLDRWVRDKLGLSYDTFVASVMLLQGQSDQLIRAQAKQRFEILSGLLDLEPYRRLEALASKKKNEAEGRMKDREKRLASTLPVSQDDLAAAQTEVEESDHTLETTNHAVTQSELCLTDARRYADLQTQLAEARQKLAIQTTLLRDEETIRRDYQEWLQIAEGRPKLRQAAHDLQSAAQATLEAAQLRSQVGTIDLEALKHKQAEAEETERRAEEQVIKVRADQNARSEAFPFLRDAVKYRSTKEKREAAIQQTGASQQWTTEATRLEELARTQKQEKARLELNYQRALDAKAQAQAGLKNAKDQLAARLSAQHEAVCSRCGQAISADHMQREQEEAAQAVAHAQGEAETANAIFQEAEQKLQTATVTRNTLEKDLQQASESLKKAQQAEHDLDEARKEFQHALDEAHHVPADLLSIVTTQSQAEAEAFLRQFTIDLKNGKDRLDKTESERKKAGDEKKKADDVYHRAMREHDQMSGKVKELEGKAQLLQEQAKVRLIDVQPAWQERILARDASLLKELEARHASLAGIEQQHAGLEQAAALRAQTAIEVNGLEQRIDGIPLEHRVAVDRAEHEVQHAKTQRAIIQKRRDTASSVLSNLKKSHEERQTLEQEAGEARRQAGRYTRLAELLGRNGVQSYLLDGAIRGITHLANETLTRISNGQLRLHIERGEDEIAIRATDLAFSDEPLDVKFISGGQKFRVAVALAAGIGQYAGRGAGSVRALIIDEGFGSLDVQGRQEIIDEIRNLSRVMERIIIVSHQEDFQDRALFPTSYVLRKVDQQTQVERFV